MIHMLVDEKMKIEFLNKLPPRIEIGKIFFCIVLEKCNSFTHNKKNSVEDYGYEKKIS